MDRWLRQPPFVTKSTHLLAYSNDNSFLQAMAGKRTEADKTSNREGQNMYSTTCIKLSNMWRKCNDVYVQRLSATNVHKSEGFRNAHRRLRNDSYIERRSAINALIRAKIFKLSAIWDRITCD